jgi:hypothetical protein
MSRSEALCDIKQQAYFYGGVVIPRPSPQAGGPPLVGCPRLLIQYIRNYPPHLEVVSSIRNLRTRHAVVTRDPSNMEKRDDLLAKSLSIFLPKISSLSFYI